MWDTAGQERFASMASLYYRGADAAILVFDCTVPKSLQSVKNWVKGKWFNLYYNNYSYPCTHFVM